MPMNVMPACPKPPDPRDDGGRLGTTTNLASRTARCRMRPAIWRLCSTTHARGLAFDAMTPISPRTSGPATRLATSTPISRASPERGAAQR
eukprot:9399738-Pyramimonas_sp.AAC.1